MSTSSVHPVDVLREAVGPMILRVHVFLDRVDVLEDRVIVVKNRALERGFVRQDVGVGPAYQRIGQDRPNNFAPNRLRAHSRSTLHCSGSLPSAGVSSASMSLFIFPNLNSDARYFATRRARERSNIARRSPTRLTGHALGSVSLPLSSP